MHDGKALREYIDTKNIDVSDLAHKLKGHRTTIYTHYKKPVLSPDLKEKYVSIFGVDIFKTSDIHKIYTGNGWEVAADDTENKYKSTPRHEANPLYLTSDPNDYDDDGSKFEHKDGIIRMRVKVVKGHKARAGYLGGFQDPEYYEPLKTISIDVEKEHKGHYLGFEVEGDSMTTTDPTQFHLLALPGWIAVARELPHHHWKNKLHINSIKHWVIVHDTEGILIKHIIKHDVDNAEITIHSINPKYKDEVLKLADIAQLWAVHNFWVK